MPAKDLNFSESSLVSTLYHERNLSVFQTVQSTSEECAEIISDFPPTENESERKLEEVEKNYKTAFHGMRMRVSSIVTNAFKLQSKDSAKAGSVSSKLKSANSFKDLKFSVPRDPYLSPYWASDKVLSQLPPTSICVRAFLFLL